MIFEHVPPQLPRRTPCAIAFVAEAPADHEVLDGIPLVGPSGRVFDKALRLAGIDRADCLVTNVLDIQAPKNDIDLLLVGKKALPEGYDLPGFSRGLYLPPALLPQLDRLKAELDACDPNIVVCLGAFSLWAFTGLSSLKDCRGAIQVADRLRPGQKVLATYHPAYTFHDNRVFTAICRDFAKALAESTNPEVHYTERTILIEPTLAQIETFFQSLSPTAPLAVDLETVPSQAQIKCVAFSQDPKTAIVVPFLDNRALSRSFWPSLDEELRAWELVRAICESPCPKVLQNGLYDLRYLFDKGIMLCNYSRDTRLAHHALYPELPKDLGSMGATYTNERAWKTYRGARQGRKREE